MTALAADPAHNGAASGEMRRHWPVVAAAFAGIMTGAWALPLFLIGSLTTPLHAEFGWTVAEVAAGAGFLAAGTTIGTPLIGFLADRYPARPLAVASVVIYTALLAAISLIDGGIWQFYALCFLLNFLGVGSGGMIYTRAIGAVFRRSRGLALGIALSGTGASAFLTPIIAQALLPELGWRGTVLALAGIVVLVALPVIIFGLRRAGDPRITGTRSGAALHGVTRRQALGDWRFYALLASVTIFGLFVAGLVVHLIPMLTTGGFSPAAAASVASLLGIAIIAGRLGIGWLLDRFPPAALGAAIFLLGAVGATMLVVVGPGAAAVTVLTTGLLLGAEVDLMSFLTLRYFGNRHYGAIYGLIFAGYSGCGMLSPLFVSGLVEHGGYELLYTVAAAGFVAAAVLMAALAIGDRGEVSPPPESLGETDG